MCCWTCGHRLQKWCKPIRFCDLNWISCGCCFQRLLIERWMDSFRSLIIWVMLLSNNSIPRLAPRITNKARKKSLIRSVIQKCQVCRTILLSYHSIFCSQQNQSQSCRESENNSWCDSRGLRDAVVSFCSCGQYRAKWGWNQAGLGQPANWFFLYELSCILSP